MRRLPTTSRRRGITLTETVVAMAVTGFVFAITGAVVVISARNSAAMHSQFLAHESAARASERLTTLLRKAKRFAVYASDSTSTSTYTRIVAYTPGANNGETPNVLAYDSATQKLNYYEGISTYTSSSNPAYSFTKISGFDLDFESVFRITMRVRYQYDGVIRFNRSAPMARHALFTTNVIAENHFKDAAQTSSTEESYADAQDRSPAALY